MMDIWHDYKYGLHRKCYWFICSLLKIIRDLALQLFSLFFLFCFFNTWNILFSFFSKMVYGKDLDKAMLGWTLVWLALLYQEACLIRVNVLLSILLISYQQKIWYCKELAHGLSSLIWIMHSLGLRRIFNRDTTFTVQVSSRRGLICV